MAGSSSIRARIHETRLKETDEGTASTNKMASRTISFAGDMSKRAIPSSRKIFAQLKLQTDACRDKPGDSRSRRAEDRYVRDRPQPHHHKADTTTTP